MKNIVAKIIGTAAYVAADLGVMTVVVKGLGKIWQKYELTEDYVENHPTLALTRIMLRIFITIAAACFICVAPAMYAINIIWSWCDNTFGDNKKDEEWD